MMKRMLLLVTILTTLFVTGNAQSMYGDKAKADVRMKYIYSFEEALKKSRETKRPIFVNCFADWAVPCHAMNQVVFCNQEFADWMDEHFVNLLIDITSHEGNPWARKYNALKMAQYLVLNENGEVIYRIVGGRQLPEFQNLLANALNEETTLPSMKQKYAEGERGLKFLRAYADVLNLADERDEARKIVDELFSHLNEKDYSKKENWNYFAQKAQDSKSELFQDLLKRKAEFVKNVGKKEVDGFIAGTYVSELFPLACGQLPYSPERMLDLTLELHRSELPDSNHVFILYHIAKYRGEKNYEQLIEYLRKEAIRLPNEWLMHIDISLGELKGLPVAERNLILDYLKQRSVGLVSAPLKYYQRSISNLENKDGIPFQDLTFDAALKKAAQEGKKLFLDCYTVWCGPCKMMSEQVFIQKEVGDFFKKHFISLKVDMEKGEGIELGKRYKVAAYPTMFILDTDGKVIYKMEGARNAQNFLEEIKKGLSSEKS